MRDEPEESEYSPPELTKYGEVKQLTEQGYPPEEFPGGDEFPGGGGPWS